MSGASWRCDTGVGLGCENVRRPVVYGSVPQVWVCGVKRSSQNHGIYTVFNMPKQILTQNE